MTTEQLVAALGSYLHSPALAAVLIAVATNFILGVRTALADGKFQWSELGGIWSKVVNKNVLTALLAGGVGGQAYGGTTGDIVSAIGSAFAAYPFAHDSLVHAGSLAVDTKSFVQDKMAPVVNAKPSQDFNEAYAVYKGVVTNSSKGDKVAAQVGVDSIKSTYPQFYGVFFGEFGEIQKLDTAIVVGLKL